MSRGYGTKETFYLVAFVVFVLVLFIPKSKVCQDDNSGDLASRPWFWPCGAGTSQINSASTS